MKIHKKLFLALAFCLSIAVGFFLNFSVNHAAAAPANVNYTATWVDRSRIKVTGDDGSSIVLTDNKWDKNWKYEGKWTDGKQCFVALSGFPGAMIVGVADDASNAWTKSGKPYNAKLSVSYTDGTSCSDSITKDVVVGDPQNAQKMFKWQDAGSITRIDGASDWSFSNPQKQTDGSIWFTRNSEANAQSCADTIVVSSDNKNFTLYEETTDFNNSAGDKSPIDSKCYLVHIYASLVAWGDSENVPSNVSMPLSDVASAQAPAGSVSGTINAAATCTNVSDAATCINQGNDSSACVASGGTGFEWILCPITTAIGKAGDLVNGFVESQLNFNVDDILRDKGCDATHCNVKKAWTIIKDIVSALVVVLMLVMVIGEAAGGQYFEAYTVKKMMPRLVISIILMQFSFTLGKYLISFSNDLGIGIKQIILAPFGGGGNMDLNSILNHLNPSYPGVSNFAIAGAIFLAIKFAKEFIMPLLICLFTAILAALLVAMGTLVFRNVIIIAAVVFSPLALLMWATPSQVLQGYWKRYTDNFMKALLLFPIVTIILYGGRIIAWMAGGNGTPDPMDYLVVMIAYFYPYILLPKTFKWGGQLLGTINQAINNSGVTQSGKKWGYGVAKSTLQEEMGKAAKSYSDNVASRKYFDRTGRLAKGLQKIGAGGLVLDKNGAGRRLPVDKNKLNLWKSGFFFENEINRRKVADKGKSWKHATDDSLDDLMRRGPETARKGEIGSFTPVLDENGEWSWKELTGGPGQDQYFAAWVRDLYSPDQRRSEAAAKALFTNPEFAIFSNTPIPLDEKNGMWKKRVELEDEMGDALKGPDGRKLRLGNYDPSHISEDWKTFNSARDGLIRKNELAKAGKATMTDAEKEQLKKMNMLASLRHHRPFTEKEIGNIKKNIKFLKENGGEIFTNPELPGVLFARPGQLRPVQDKAVTTPELTQAISGMRFEDIPAVRSRLSRNGWKSISAVLADEEVEARMKAAGLDSSDIAGVLADPIIRQHLVKNGINPDKVVDSAFFNDTDTENYGEGDQKSPGRTATYNESSWYSKARKVKNAWRKGKFAFGLHDKNNTDGDTLLEGLTDLRYFTSAVLDRQDPTISQILTNILSVKSTATGFSNMLASIGGPAEIASLLNDYKGTQWEGQAKSNTRNWLEIRSALGIDPMDTGPITPRDIRILEAIPQYQHYYPHADAKFVRYIFDNLRDQKNRRDLSAKITDANWSKHFNGDRAAYESYKRLATAAVDPADPPADLDKYVPDKEVRGRQRLTDDQLAAQVNAMIVRGELPTSAIEPVPVDSTGKGWRVVIPPKGAPSASSSGSTGSATINVPYPNWGRSSRLQGMKRAAIPDAPAAREKIAQQVYKTMNGGLDVDLSPQIIAAIENAHTSFNDPSYAKDPSRPVGFNNYKPEALVGKRNIIMDAILREIPDKVFARRFAGEMIARGIAGESGEDAAPPTSDPSVLEIPHDQAAVAEAVAKISASAPAVQSTPMMAPPSTPPPPSIFGQAPVNNITQVTNTIIQQPQQQPLPQSVFSTRTQPEGQMRVPHSVQGAVGPEEAKLKGRIEEDRMRHIFQDSFKQAMKSVASPQAQADQDRKVDEAADNMARRMGSGGRGA